MIRHRIVGINIYTMCLSYEEDNSKLVPDVLNMVSNWNTKNANQQLSHLYLDQPGGGRSSTANLATSNAAYFRL